MPTLHIVRVITNMKDHLCYLDMSHMREAPLNKHDSQYIQQTNKYIKMRTPPTPPWWKVEVEGPIG